MNYPPAILAVGRNYQHPGGPPPPDHVVFFLKNPASLIGTDEPIIIPKACRSHDMVDFEAELAIELGDTIKDADAKAARGAIARCMPANDVTCRWWEQ
ncbi:MAG TPA: fumarylacetoacetate hydrolase family protein, partial [Phycisphaerales bacterium]|nr:fumarylacetoacetate hydrolase family protein [Phycisphaerales bacterium]